MKERLNEYINENLKALPRIRRRLNNYQTSKVDDYINESNKESHFQELLFKYIDDKNLKDSDVYNKVHIDRRLFSKIRSDINYHPSKETVILLGLSLNFNSTLLFLLLSLALTLDCFCSSESFLTSACFGVCLKISADLAKVPNN